MRPGNGQNTQGKESLNSAGVLQTLASDRLPPKKLTRPARAGIAFLPKADAESESPAPIVYAPKWAEVHRTLCVDPFRGRAENPDWSAAAEETSSCVKGSEKPQHCNLPTFPEMRTI